MIPCGMRVPVAVWQPCGLLYTCYLLVTSLGCQFGVWRGTLKTRDWKTQERKTRDQIAGVAKAGLENAGTSCVWVAKCNIINVRGHVRVNVTARRGDPRTLQEAIQSGN